MQDRQNIAVFIDFDNIEIGVKSTLRREFDVSATLDALRERGDIISKFAYANWGHQPSATRQMAENAVQMVQRNPSPRGDKNAGDINLAIDALEMAFTHDHVTAFAIVSGDSDFNPLVNKLKEYGKTVYVVGGKAFTSTILQRNCHEFIAYESLIDDKPARQKEQKGHSQRTQKKQVKTLDPARAVPLVERALQVLERRNVRPQLGLMKSTMLQLDSRFSEKTYGVSSFSDFVEKLREAGYVNVTGKGGEATIERKATVTVEPSKLVVKPEEALPPLRDVLETHRMDVENGCNAEDLASWVSDEMPEFDWNAYGFQEFAELLNFAQDKGVVRVEPSEEEGLLVYLGTEFYPLVEPETETKADRPASKKAPARKTSRRPRKRKAE